MTDGAEDEQARRDARWAAYEAQSRRAAQKIQLALVPLWAAGALFWWFDPQADAVVRWLFTALAVMWLALAVVLWRQLRRPVPPVPGKGEAPGR